MFLLQEYDFEVVYCPKRKHVMADHLSRIECGEPARRVADQLPDASLLMVYFQPEEDWRSPLMEYLTHGRLLSPEVTEDEQSRIRRLSESYVLDEGELKRISPSG